MKNEVAGTDAPKRISRSKKRSRINDDDKQTDEVGS